MTISGRGIFIWSLLRGFSKRRVNNLQSRWHSRKYLVDEILKRGKHMRGKLWESYSMKSKPLILLMIRPMATQTQWKSEMMIWSLKTDHLNVCLSGTALLGFMLEIVVCKRVLHKHWFLASNVIIRWSDFLKKYWKFPSDSLKSLHHIVTN